MTRNSHLHNYAPNQNQSTHYQQKSAPQTTQNIVFRPLPFYDKICEIIVPTVLQSYGSLGRPNESQIEFKLSIDMADAVAMSRHDTHIVLRFCHIDLLADQQDDNFPPDVIINVNGRQVILPPAIANPNKPNVPAKRPGQHVDITKECKLCPFINNYVNIKWLIDPTEPQRQYACSLIVGIKQTAETLLNRIKQKGLSDPTATMKIIADTDNEVATTNLQCSLLCPLGKMRMSAPCKSIRCKHIPCFDAMIYLQMNEKKATWICPVCYKPAYFPDLMIDGYFTAILTNTASSVTDVTLNLDGSWNPVLKMEQPSYTGNHDQSAPEVITISDDDDD